MTTADLKATYELKNDLYQRAQHDRVKAMDAYKDALRADLLAAIPGTPSLPVLIEVETDGALYGPYWMIGVETYESYKFGWKAKPILRQVKTDGTVGLREPGYKQRYPGEIDGSQIKVVS